MEKIKKEQAKKKTKISAKALKQELEQCEKVKNEYLAGWQRERADLLNYKKQEAERISSAIKYANQGLVPELLALLDSFDAAEHNLSSNLKKDSYIKGILQIKIQLQDFLKDQGLEQIKCLGEKFNPEFHEAIEPSFTKASEDKQIEPGTIIEEVQKGYKLHDKIIRPAKVKISK